ncbi:hypothetical protein C8R45DRAFT_946679 [Mycena sanguinolenta]|nr:hypothetical protein C8R45DRAFT_946679 [Mycena sanguinolenta]
MQNVRRSALGGGQDAFRHPFRDGLRPIRSQPRNGRRTAMSGSNSVCSKNVPDQVFVRTTRVIRSFTNDVKGLSSMLLYPFWMFKRCALFYFAHFWRLSFGDVIRKNSPPGIPQPFQNAVISKSPAADNSLLGSSPSLSLASRVDQLSLVLAGAVLSTPPCWPSSTRLRDTRQALDALVLRLNGLKGGYMHVFWVDKVLKRKFGTSWTLLKTQFINTSESKLKIASIPSGINRQNFQSVSRIQGSSSRFDASQDRLFSPVTDSHPFKSLLYTIVLLLSGLQRLTPPPICLTIVFSYQSWTRPSNAGSRISNLYLRRSRLSMEILLRVGSRPFVPWSLAAYFVRVCVPFGRTLEQTLACPSGLYVSSRAKFRRIIFVHKAVERTATLKNAFPFSLRPLCRGSTPITKTSKSYAPSHYQTARRLQASGVLIDVDDTDASHSVLYLTRLQFPQAFCKTDSKTCEAKSQMQKN